jgi:DNA-binding NtrC family response regulator
LAIGQSIKSVILSTGMSTLEEIEQALDLLSYGYLNKPFDGDHMNPVGAALFTAKVVDFIKAPV